MKNEITLGLLFTAFMVASCVSHPPQDFKSLTELQPMVLQVEPPGGSSIENPVEFLLHFSQRVDIQSISPLSIALIRDGWREDFIKDTKLLIDSLEQQELELIPLHYQLDGEEKTLLLTPQIPLEDGRYVLTVTPRLSSILALPFNQSPGNTPRAWAASYGLGMGQDVSTGPNPEAPSHNYGPAPQSLVINEVLYDGKVSETDGEAFIELFGTPGADISAYTVLLINGADGEATESIALPEDSFLDGDGFFVMADLRTNSQDKTLVAHFDFLDQFDPQNGPDAVQLFNRSGQLLDAVCYGQGSVDHTPEGLPLCEGNPTPDVVAGHSLSRRNEPDTQDNYLDFFENTSPSPGQP
jgi:hypothetical protein